MLFLDCEFNGHGGRLLSMALVSDDGDEFYEVLFHYKSALVWWVQENVCPVLNKESIEHAEFETKLHAFLKKHVGETIVADSPADFIYLLNNMHNIVNGKYKYINLEVNMQFTPSDKYESEIPHNALSDARALMKWYKENR